MQEQNYDVLLQHAPYSRSSRQPCHASWPGIERQLLDEWDAAELMESHRPGLDLIFSNGEDCSGQKDGYLFRTHYVLADKERKRTTSLTVFVVRSARQTQSDPHEVLLPYRTSASRATLFILPPEPIPQQTAAHAPELSFPFLHIETSKPLPCVAVTLEADDKQRFKKIELLAQMVHNGSDCPVILLCVLNTTSHPWNPKF